MPHYIPTKRLTKNPCQRPSLGQALAALPLSYALLAVDTLIALESLAHKGRDGGSQAHLGGRGGGFAGTRVVSDTGIEMCHIAIAIITSLKIRWERSHRLDGLQYMIPHSELIEPTSRINFRELMDKRASLGHRHPHHRISN